MQYLLLIYNDDKLLQALPDGEADDMMRHCFANADAMKAQGQLLQSQQLEAAASARQHRVFDAEQHGHRPQLLGEPARAGGQQAISVQSRVVAEAIFPFA